MVSLPEDVRGASAALGAAVPRVEEPAPVSKAKAQDVDAELVKFIVLGVTSDNAQVGPQQSSAHLESLTALA